MESSSYPNNYEFNEVTKYKVNILNINSTFLPQDLLNRKHYQI